MKKKNFNKITLLLLSINFLLLVSTAFQWFSVNKFKENFNDFSKIAASFGRELGGVREQIGDLTKTINKLGNIGEDLLKIKESLDELSQEINKLGNIGEDLLKIKESLDELSQEVEKQVTNLVETGDKINVSLDSVAEIQEQLNQLSKLGVGLENLGGIAKNLEKRFKGGDLTELKDSLNDAIEKVDEIICSSCKRLKIVLPKLITSSTKTDNDFEEKKWKTMFKNGRLILRGKIEEIWYTESVSWMTRVLSNLVENTKNPEEIEIKKLDNSVIGKISACEENSYFQEVREGKIPGNPETSLKKKFTLEEKKSCDSCLQKFTLKNFDLYKEPKKIIELFND